ncbi:hypothetical protein AKJ09_00123 [Labilithrix luteola]|uniref:Uncharacterized protein n=1 Tax=Labilithrix luteola TaxID=1391654 RepID=A0A0K1PK19_9BACT|nr:hypothetical protein AKJ09_00123 [Labilithrix luteola]
MRAGTAFQPSSASLPLELTWTAPHDCPQAAAVVARVEEILKGPPLSPTTVRAEGAIHRSSAARFDLELTIRTGEDEDRRRIDATSCSALAEASAVVIALAVDRARTSAQPSSPDAAASSSSAPEADAGPSIPKAPASAKPSPFPSSPPSPATASERALRFSVGLSPALDVGTLPHAAGGLILDTALRLRRLRVGLLGSAWLPQDVEFEPVTHAGATFTMLTGGAWAAYMFPIGPLSLGPTADVEATFVHLEGFGIRAPASSWTSWTTVVLGARFEARLTRWLALTARAAMTLPIDPPTFTLGPSSSSISLHEPSAISGRFSIGPEFVFP